MTEYNVVDTSGRLQTSSGRSQPSSVEDQFLWEPSQSRLPSSASSYADLNFLFGVQDPTMIISKPNRNRRKSNLGPEHAKHRRTRSGCYTCRSRRVKCDETHPICDRCRKGGRDCVYPETSVAKATGSASTKTQAPDRESPGSSSDELEDDEEAGPDRLERIADEDEGPDDKHDAQGPSKQATQRNTTTTTTSARKSASRQDSETPSLVQDKGASPTPSTEGSVGYSTYQIMANVRNTNAGASDASMSGPLRSDWSHLPPDLQFYLTYFYENITHLHYSLKFDPNNFLRTSFLDAALRNEALLYAIVGFAAFQRTLHNPAGKIQDFLEYYNKAVSLLLHALKKGEKHTNGMILAILQLATIEEFLGDWINLLGHQKAAYEMLTGLYTPETIMKDNTSRMILGWYIRFDVFAGLMAGFGTVLSRQWFSYAREFFREKVNKEPGVLNWRIELAIARHRLVATDMSLLFAKKGKGEISHEQFLRENEDIGRRIAEWKTQMDPALQDKQYLVTDFAGARPLDPNDIVNPYIPGTIYQGPLFVMNVATIDWYSIDLMHKYQTALTLQTQPGAELGMKAYEVCQLYEALEFWPHSPPGIVLACQASLGIACLFLPRDVTHAMWARRKFAGIEANGYIYPYTFRTKMADLFRDRSCMRWWLPNDEAYPPIIRSIRKFVEDRTAPAKDMPTKDLQDIKAIFASLKLDDGKPSIPPAPKHASSGVVVAPNQDSYIGPDPMQGMSQRDAYGDVFDEGQGFWGEGQGGSVYGVPRPDDYR